MGLEIRTFDGGRGTFVHYMGRVEDEEFIRVHSAHLLDHSSRLHQFRYSISDSTEVTSVGVSNGAIRRLANAIKQASVGHPGLVHVSVHPTMLAYGLGRMNDMLIQFQSHWEFHTVREMPKAKAYIRDRCKDLFGIDDVAFELDPEVFVPNDVQPSRVI